ncbi:hypothetical protein K438DRAFT_1764652 [Mycena galopus ATCC 62051]|nr:hypothetical protein K438DRAFT_1764652 [Mycena galopus ATCC 62051]
MAGLELRWYFGSRDRKRRSAELSYSSLVSSEVIGRAIFGRAVPAISASKLPSTTINDTHGLERKAGRATGCPGTEADLDSPPRLPMTAVRLAWTAGTRTVSGTQSRTVREPSHLRPYWVSVSDISTSIKDAHPSCITQLRSCSEASGTYKTRSTTTAVGHPGANGRTVNMIWTVYPVPQLEVWHSSVTAGNELWREHMVSVPIYIYLPFLVPRCWSTSANALVDPTETQRIDGILLHCKKEVAAEIHDEERDNGMEASCLGKVNKAVVYYVLRRCIPIRTWGSSGTDSLPRTQTPHVNGFDGEGHEKLFDGKCNPVSHATYFSSVRVDMFAKRQGLLGHATGSSPSLQVRIIALRLALTHFIRAFAVEPPGATRWLIRHAVPGGYPPGTACRKSHLVAPGGSTANALFWDRVSIDQETGHTSVNFIWNDSSMAIKSKQIVRIPSYASTENDLKQQVMPPLRSGSSERVRKIDIIQDTSTLCGNKTPQGTMKIGSCSSSSRQTVGGRPPSRHLWYQNSRYESTKCNTNVQRTDVKASVPVPGLGAKVNSRGMVAQHTELVPDPSKDFADSQFQLINSKNKIPRQIGHINADEPTTETAVRATQKKPTRARMVEKSHLGDRERLQIITHSRFVELSMETRDLNDTNNFPIPQTLVGTKPSIAEPGSREKCSKTSRHAVAQARIFPNDYCGPCIEAKRSGES